MQTSTARPASTRKATLTDFQALAELGQPLAQLDLALMYRAGQGAQQSDIHAYAWAMLAAQNGEAKGRKLADEIRPQLAPGSERISEWITAPYTPAALSRRLMPVRALKTPEAMAEHHKWVEQCRPVSLYKWVYPMDARYRGIQGDVFVAYTLMPDGRARIPRVILEVPPGIFGAATRESILRDGFAPLPPGSAPVHCVSFYRYTMGQSAYDSPQLDSFVENTRRHAIAGDPGSQLLYGMLLVGLPQLEKTSNAGL